MEHARKRDVVEVMARRLRERSLLAPAGHAAEDELRIACEAVIGTEAKPLHHARPKSFDERVGGAGKAQHEVDALPLLEIDGDCVPAAVQDLEAGMARKAEATRLLAVDAQHGGAEIGEQHGAHRCGADACHLDDLESCKRSHGLPPDETLSRHRSGSEGDLAPIASRKWLS